MQQQEDTAFLQVPRHPVVKGATERRISVVHWSTERFPDPRASATGGCRTDTS